jgi:proteic killer suppression protein
MEVRFTDDDLSRMETDLVFTGKHGAQIARAFRRAMQYIRSATDERDIYAMKSLRFEKLKGERSHERSLRLNDQWRLIVEIEAANPKNTVVVKGIEDYH